MRDIGISYITPIDFATDTLGKAVDFIYSNAVLEHVPKTDVVTVLSNLACDLKSEGIMLHNIHLEDHKDSIKEPFAFLSETESRYNSEIQSWRGNRIRQSEWVEIFEAIPNMEFKIIYTFIREDANIPDKIDASIKYKNEDDLRTSNIGVLGIKK
ncbi:MAG: hypothetical protein ACFFED_07795 [Candidatus Thorarchaeota archaeon]